MGENQSLTKRTFVGLIWASCESMAKVLLQVGVMIILSRLLTPADFGITGMALAIIGITQIFAQLGLGPAVVQRHVLEMRHIKTAMSFSLAFSLLSGVVILLIAPWLSRFVGMPALERTLQALSVLFPLTGASVVPESLLQRELKFRTLARIEISSYAIGFATVSLTSAVLGFGLWSIVFGQWLWIGIRTVLMLHGTAGQMGLGFEWKALKELWEFSGGQTVVGVANYVASNGDNLVVGKFLGPQALGIYNRAWQLTPIGLIGQVLDKVLFPALSKVQSNRELLQRAFRQGTQLVSVVILPITVMTIVLAPDAVPLALGNKWLGVVLPLQLLSLGLLWRFGMKINNSFIRACGAVNLLAVCQIFYAISLTLCSWIGSRWGLQGVCLAILPALFAVYLFSLLMCLRLTRLRLSTFIFDHVPGFLLCGLTLIGAWFSYYVLHARSLPPVLTILLAGTVMSSFVAIAFCIWPEQLLGEYGKKVKALIIPVLNKRDPQLNKHLRPAPKNVESNLNAKT